MITLITPTGGRPKQIELCAEFMHNQDYDGRVTWVIIDDVDPKSTSCIEKNFRKGWDIIKIYPEEKWKIGDNTQSRNLQLGITELHKVKTDAGFVIEDDDYYTPHYISRMLEKLKGYDLAGEKNTIYYNLATHGFRYNLNTQHASLFQVTFAPSLINLFETICVMRKKFIDIELFREAERRGFKVNLFNTEHLSIGMKGMPGRPGIGIGHRMNNHFIEDKDDKKLKELTGSDFIYYVLDE